MEDPKMRQQTQTAFSSTSPKKDDAISNQSSEAQQRKEKIPSPAPSKIQRRGSADLILEAAKLAETMGNTSPKHRRVLSNSSGVGKSVIAQPLPSAKLPDSELKASLQNNGQSQRGSRDETSPVEVQPDAGNDFNTTIVTPPTTTAVVNGNGTSQTTQQTTVKTTSASIPLPPPANTTFSGRNLQVTVNSSSTSFKAPSQPELLFQFETAKLQSSGTGLKPPPLKHNVPHVYHDYANVPDTIGFVRKKTGGVTQPFPEKLYEMLASESDDSPDGIVSWIPHGRAFIVRKPKKFTSEIMPKYFRQTKLTSFQRQLNLYGFRRITQGADSGAYYHELFLRGRPQLCMRMVRQKVKGTGHKQPTDVGSEPNFYTMPSLADLAQPPPSASPSSPIVRPTCGFSTMPVATMTVPVQTIATMPTTTATLSTGGPMSPGVQAAHLLKGMSQGNLSQTLPPLPANFSSSSESKSKTTLMPTLNQRDANPQSLQSPSIKIPKAENPGENMDEGQGTPV